MNLIVLCGTRRRERPSPTTPQKEKRLSSGRQGSESASRALKHATVVVNHSKNNMFQTHNFENEFEG